MTPAPPQSLTNPRIVAIPVAFNEAHAIGNVLDRFKDLHGVDVAVSDDGSTDQTPEIVQSRGVTLISQPQRRGVGAAIRTAYDWSRTQGYDICVILSGNDKDRPGEIPRLVEPIIQGVADLVQGSRYLLGGHYHNMPLYRQGCSRLLHPWLFALVARQYISDTTNGFRALRLSVLDDPRINLRQSWLDQYELEPYLLIQAIRHGYVVREVPVTKIYPPAGKPYTKMRPILDWWSILRPIVLLGLGVKK